jgi:uncharacterized protein YggU (UPF0235/DUF167 family)
MAVRPRPEHPCLRYAEHGELIVQVLVVPGSSQTKIEGLHGEGAQQCLRIRLQAPPVDGQANTALLRALVESTTGCSPVTAALEQPLAVGLHVEVTD